MPSRRPLAVTLALLLVLAMATPAAAQSGGQQPGPDPRRREVAKAAIGYWHEEYGARVAAWAWSRRGSELPMSRGLASRVRERADSLDHGPAWWRRTRAPIELLISPVSDYEGIVLGTTLTGGTGDEAADELAVAWVAMQRELVEREVGHWALVELAAGAHQAAVEHLAWVRSLDDGTLAGLGDRETVDRMLAEAGHWVELSRARLAGELGDLAPLVEAVVELERAGAAAGAAERAHEGGAAAGAGLAELRARRRAAAGRVQANQAANVRAGSFEGLGPDLALRVARAKVRALAGRVAGAGGDQAAADLALARLELAAAEAGARLAAAGEGDDLAQLELAAATARQAWERAAGIEPEGGPTPTRPRTGPTPQGGGASRGGGEGGGDQDQGGHQARHGDGDDAKASLAAAIDDDSAPGTGSSEAGGSPPGREPGPKAGAGQRPEPKAFAAAPAPNPTTAAPTPEQVPAPVPAVAAATRPAVAAPQPPRTEGGHPVPVPGGFDLGAGDEVGAGDGGGPPAKLPPCLAEGIQTYSTGTGCRPDQGTAGGGWAPCEPGAGKGVVALDTGGKGCEGGEPVGGQPPGCAGDNPPSVLTFDAGCGGQVTGGQPPPCTGATDVLAMMTLPCQGKGVTVFPQPCPDPGGIMAFDAGSGCQGKGQGGPVTPPPCLGQAGVLALTLPGCDSLPRPDIFAAAG